MKPEISKARKEIDIIANTMVEPGLSGGNRIFIELSKQLAKRGIAINIFTSSEGEKICKENGLKKANYYIWKIPPYYERKITRLSRLDIFVLYFFGLFQGLRNYHNFLKGDHKARIIWTTSDYWPDSVVGITAKFVNRSNFWIGSLFLFAPRPWQKDNPYKGKRFLTGLFYWLTQLPIYWIVKRYADFVFVTSEPDVEKFVTKKRCKDKIVVVQGGVDIKPSKKYLNFGKVIPLEKRKYDACFVGRFHYQKGVLELVDIWKYVCDKKPDAKLAMVGIGPLEKDVKRKIKKLGLENNIELHGFKDGEEKYEVFKQSKIVVHPATYDSGGMATAEGMAWGLPGVSFDLESLKTYYPRGMVKTKCFEIEEFAGNILKLLSDKNFYNEISRQAHNLIVEIWDWEKRAEKIFNQCFNK